MKRKLLLFVIGMIWTGMSYAGTYGGGDGSSGNPYVISTLAHLSELSTTTADWVAGKYFIQTADIDASATSTWNSNTGWSPIGNTTTAFSGSYDGDGHTIDHLYISRYGWYQGFFGKISDATISDLGITNVSITVTSTSNYIGGLAGWSVGASTVISGCYSTGSISSNEYRAGGLIGQHENGLVKESWSSVNITAGSGTAQRFGGFIGQVSSGTVNSCYSTGSVTGIKDQSGAFIGFAGGTITNCYCMGSITRVSGGTGVDIGAFSGTSGYWISSCYSTGSVYYDGTDAPTNKGFHGQAGGTFANANNFFDSDVSNQSTGVGATAKTTALMKTKATFTNAGWNFTTIWAMKSDYNNGYPNLDGENDPIDYTWDGSADNDWNTAANWNLNAVPTAADNVIITTDGNAPSIYNDGTGASCNNLTINSGATLTINDGGSLITNGTITNNGTVNMKQEFTSSNKWELISMPASGITANTFWGMYLQQWNETTGSWSDITSPSTPLTPVKGFSYYAKDYNSGKPTGYTLTYTGTPNTGIQSIAITDNGTGGSYDGANLLGNPYPSYLDWDEVDGYGTKYTWNGYDYDEYTESGSGSGNRYVEPMQGFFIVTGSAGTFSLTNSMRTNTHTSSKKSGDEKALQNSIVLSAFGNDYEDQLWLVLDEQASEAFELQNDAWKLLSSTEGISQLWSVSSSGKLAVDVRPQTETIQLGFTNDVAGIYTIGVSEIADITTAVLEDTKANLFHDLTKGAYEFAWDLTDDESRFKLHLGVTGIESLQQQNNNLLMYASGQTIYLKAIEGRASGLFTMTDMSGRILMHKELDFSGLMTIPVNVKPGVYVVSLTSDVSSAIKKVVIQ